jgi:hypothetical protein
MAWKYKPVNAWQRVGASRVVRAHWFEADAHWSLCGKVPHGDEWIDDVASARTDCRACEKRIMRMEER